MKIMKYYKKLYLTLVSVFLMINATGCEKDKALEVGENESQAIAISKQRIYDESEKIAEDYRSIYEQAVKEGALESVKTRKQIMEIIGASGYAVSDVNDEINTVNPEQIEQFCRQVEEQIDASLTICCIINCGGFIRYDLQSVKGKVEVTRSLLTWDGRKPEADYMETYPAYAWEYSDKGYLFFRQYHPPGSDGASGYTAIRTKPLDDRYREWNREYIEPIGYQLNNMFITDWNEKNYGELEFYDLYEIMYEMKYEEESPYEFAYTGLSYEVPRLEFEQIFKTYFQIDSETLQGRTVYDKERGTYRYRPRGMFDCAATSDVPFPEVVDGRENEDGTITLTVNAVWPAKNQACAFVHEVTVRPLGEGRCQYVSNHVVSEAEYYEPSWYVKRLADEEWEDYYEDM